MHRDPGGVPGGAGSVQREGLAPAGLAHHDLDAGAVEREAAHHGLLFIGERWTLGDRLLHSCRFGDGQALVLASEDAGERRCFDGEEFGVL